MLISANVGCVYDLKENPLTVEQINLINKHKNLNNTYAYPAL